MRAMPRVLRWLVPVAAVAALAVMPSTARSITGTQKWAVVLCNFSNQNVQPYSISYYQQLFQGTGSSIYDFQDYWSNNSYGNVSVAGTTVTGWHTLGITRDAWEALDRDGKRQACGDKAAADGFSFSGYYGFVTIFPEAKTTLASSINSSQTTITVTSANSGNEDLFPTPPFALVVCNSVACNTSETVNVTAINGTTFTVQRGQAGTTAKAFSAPGYLIVPGDIFGQGPTSWTFGGNNYTLGSAFLPSDVNMTGAAHESGHGFGYPHSRKLSTSTQDYNDCYDIMSAYATCSFSADFGGSNLGSVNAAAGPGITGILLDQQGWLAGGRVFDLDNSSCNQTTMDLVALNQNGISGKFVARVPASVVINTPGNTTTTSDKYWIEYREATGWDSGVPPGVVLHLHGADNYAYWVDSATSDGRLVAGEEYVDAGQKTYVAVNKIDTGTHKAQLTLAGCKIDTSLKYSGDTTADFNDQATLAADLTVQGSGAPIPSHTVTLALGSQSCSATTNAAGHAECTILSINQDPGSYTATASFAGDAAYNSSSGSAAFTITKEESQVAYTGATTSDYHDPFTASAVLTDPDGGAPIANKTITFTLGAGDTCSDTTDAFGVASCSITPTQAAGSYTLSADFAGNVDYLPSNDSPSFTITKEETTLTYTGPTVVLQGASGVTLKAQLVEDGTSDDDADGGSPAPVPSGQTITLSLGGQSCTGTTDSSGVATCTLVFNGALGPQPIGAVFAGDAYYLPSSDTSKTAVVFAFPSRGAFVIGDSTLAGSPASVDWWNDAWWKLNALSGGAAPPSFKGFAGTVQTLPTESPANSCGTTFTTRPGNSTPPTGEVPSYMGVLVASSVDKSGSDATGAWGRIVVVSVDPGYEPNPGHHGSGSIVATFCP